MKKYCYLLLCFLFLLGGCGKKETETAKDAQSFGTEEAILSEVPGSAPEEEAITPEPMSLADMLEDITDAIDESDPAVWYHHYKNRYIVYENGFTYRIFSDGIYRRAAGSEDWELLYHGDMSYNHSLDYYKDYLYFTLDREGEPPDAVFVRQTLWQLNLNTLECKKIGDMIEDLPYIFAVYDGNLYIGYTRFMALRYDVYPLDEQGMPGEKMEEASPDFLCAGQNAYSREEDKYGYSFSGRLTVMSPDTPEMAREVIPTPLCASMLNGYYLTTRYRDELFSHFYLTNSAGEEQPLFDACMILAVTPAGLYYFGDGTESSAMHYYSFYQKESLPLLYPEDTYEFYSLLTYDRAWLYIRGDSCILRMSRSTGDIEVFLDNLPEDTDFKHCAVDPEYFYLGEEMYPI